MATYPSTSSIPRDANYVPVSSGLRDDGTGTITPLLTNAVTGALIVDLGATSLDVNVNGWFGSTAPTVGQKAMVSSIPIVIASDQSSLPVTVGNFPTTQDVNVTNASLAVTGPLTDTQLRASSVTVSGPLTDVELRATPVPVTATFTPSGTQDVNVTNASIAVTGTFFQATQPVSIASSVPVTGPLTDTELRASAVPVSLTSTTISNFPATQAVSAASLPLPTGAATSALQGS